MPDIEKRLEAFVRLGHGIVVFPGGAGTAEEILYLLGILLDPANSDLPFPVVFTGPADCEDYFRQIHDFIGATLGETRAVPLPDHHRRSRPRWRAPWCTGFAQVRDYRRRQSDSYGFNWLLNIPLEFQLPFEVTHESMRALRLSRDQPVHERAANLRRAFSGIVAGNIKEYGINAIERYGPFELTRRAVDHGAARSAAALLRGAAAHEIHRRGIHALLPARGMSEPLLDPLSVRLARRIAEDARFQLRSRELPAHQPAARRSAVLDRAQIQPVRQLPAERRRSTRIARRRCRWPPRSSR